MVLQNKRVTKYGPDEQEAHSGEENTWDSQKPDWDTRGKPRGEILLSECRECMFVL